VEKNMEIDGEKSGTGRSFQMIGVANAK